MGVVVDRIERRLNPLFHRFFLPEKAVCLLQDKYFFQRRFNYESSHYGRWFRDSHEALDD